HFEAAAKVNALLRDAMIRSEADLGNEGLGKKVRNAKNMRIPYFIVIGDKDLAANKVTLESRDKGQIGQMEEGEVVRKLVEEIIERK
ncbi:MAG: His/Gly/Thr/Pro-type tRNA ligase C-terminal domain-containing protein, partial [Candidatus Taylorbacteria bacterium]|nr:His/Gly/Thr/Pro-type tRNA ligase C-terminal domain-containing protein [Candidatus Taylorbacteria bacterium]